MSTWRNAVPEEDQERYRRAGFQPVAGLGDRPALLIIDVQYRTLGRPRAPIDAAMESYATACGEAGWQAVDRLVPLLAAFRDRELPVLYPYVAPKQEFDTGRLRDINPTLMDVDAEGYEFAEQIRPRPSDVLVPKRHPSAFFATPLTSYLIDRGVDSLVVAGCTTSGCVRASVVDAFAFNFRVAVAEDCVYDRSATSHAVNLFDMSMKYAEVAPSEELIDRIG